MKIFGLVPVTRTLVDQRQFNVLRLGCFADPILKQQHFTVFDDFRGIPFWLVILVQAHDGRLKLFDLIFQLHLFLVQLQAYNFFDLADFSLDLDDHHRLNLLQREFLLIERGFEKLIHFHHIIKNTKEVCYLDQFLVSKAFLPQLREHLKKNLNLDDFIFLDRDFDHHLHVIHDMVCGKAIQSGSFGLLFFHVGFCFSISVLLS